MHETPGNQNYETEFFVKRNELAKYFVEKIEAEIPIKTEVQKKLLHIACLATADVSLRAVLHYDTSEEFGVIAWSVFCLPEESHPKFILGNTFSIVFYDIWGRTRGRERQIEQIKRLRDEAKEKLAELEPEAKDKALLFGASVASVSLFGLKILAQKYGLTLRILRHWLFKLFSPITASFYYEQAKGISTGYIV